MLGDIQGYGKPAGWSITRQLQSQNSEVRRVAVRALGRIEPDNLKAIEAIIATLGDSDKDVRRAAIGSLHCVGPKAMGAVAKLLLVLKDEDDDLRVAAAMALGSIGAAGAEVVQGLKEALNKCRAEDDKQTILREINRLQPKRR